MEKLRITCSADPHTGLLREKVKDTLKENFDITYSSIDSSQRKVLEHHNPELIFIDCELMNEEQYNELRGFLHMISKHFTDTPVIVRAPIMRFDERQDLEKTLTENVLGVIGVDRAYEYIPGDIDRILETGKPDKRIYIN